MNWREFLRKYWIIMTIVIILILVLMELPQIKLMYNKSINNIVFCQKDSDCYCSACLGICANYEIWGLYEECPPPIRTGNETCQEDAVCKCINEKCTSTDCQSNGGKCYGFGDFVKETCEDHGMIELPYRCPEITLNTRCCKKK